MTSAAQLTISPFQAKHFLWFLGPFSFDTFVVFLITGILQNFAQLSPIICLTTQIPKVENDIEIEIKCMRLD